MPTPIQPFYDERARLLAKATEVVDTAKKANRGLTTFEQKQVDNLLAEVDRVDRQISGTKLANSVMGLGTADARTSDGETLFLSLRSPRVKSDLTSRFGAMVGTPGLKALVPDGEAVASIPMDAEVYREGIAPTSLIEVLPTIERPAVYRYMRQTARDNNAAPVAPGAVKPTSTYGLTPVEGRLHVIAHVSEPIDKYVLQDGPSLGAFVQAEMVAGLHQAVETQIVSGDGTGENLTGLAETSGIQTQAYSTSPVLTARAAITKVEVLGFAPAWYVLNPVDWERVETATLDAGQYVLNAEGSRNGVPVDSAARRLWGVGVTVSTAVPSGTGYLLSNGAVQLVTTGSIETEMSSATSDDFVRNAVRLRVESRFDLAVTRPLGVVQMDLTA